MNRKIPCLVVGFVVAGVVSANAQATLMPSYNAPYRAFETHEFGATLSFPGGGSRESRGNTVSGSSSSTSARGVA